ncbi:MULTISPECIES: FGGY-family carbohydrate kinase [unclassified Achromobacter]|uniref:xylulokinase n=1 Tax=unclassified Achromobacter TaxID=2626865 RepID=UPI000B516D2B|nr:MULTISPECIES: FGGY-family carbohydrate kinase [unclassified Achromobacter]OWT70303.1 carbohydrate kinase [Achromobacter sp. HZ34]OWT71843.1 carbohydrate kinase [Achromobacter sp. HZ28]
MSVVLACDLGGTSFRAALYDAQGQVWAEHALPSPTDGAGAAGGQAEIDADEWWAILISLADALAAQAPARFAEIRGIAICGVTRTQILLDDAGQPLRPALTWRDTRAAPDIEALLARLPQDHPELPQVNAFHPMARLDWLRRHEPTVLAQACCVLEPKDYLNFRLTGVRASDPVSMARLHAAAAPLRPSLLAAAGLAAGLLPPLLSPTDAVGTVSAGLPGALAQLAGVPVFCCANDTWAAVAGLGALRAGHAYNISGTTEVFGVIADVPHGQSAPRAAGLMTVDWGDGLHQIGGPGQNGADTMAWLLSVVQGAGSDQQSLAARVEALLAAPRDPQPVLFLPYLQGERVPYWDADLRGAFVGLNRRHGAGDLAWAVLEGVAFLNRLVLERGEAALGAAVTEIRFGGGAAANAAWCQVKADICGRPVSVGTAREPGALGAAVVAWTGLGHFPSLAAAQESVVREARRYLPDPARQRHYGALYQQYRATEAALAPVSKALVGMSK